MKLFELFENKDTAIVKKMARNAQLNMIRNALKNSAEVIKRDCSPYLKAIGTASNILYRGVFDTALNKGSYVNGTLITQLKTFANRRPRDTSEELTELIDEWFLKNKGHAFRTNNVVFGTGDRQRTEDYGIPCMCFPIGDIKFVWSNEYGDLFDDQGLPDELQNLSIGGVIEDDLNLAKKLINLRMKNGKYSTKNLPTAIKSFSEISIMCKSYYLLPTIFTDSGFILSNSVKNNDEYFTDTIEHKGVTYYVNAFTGNHNLWSKKWSPYEWKDIGVNLKNTEYLNTVKALPSGFFNQEFISKLK